MRTSIQELAGAPPLETSSEVTNSQPIEETRGDLMSEIVKGNFKLKPVKQ